MLLHSLRIRAYRNYVDLTIPFEDDCTVILGENNAGKTNVLDALYAALRVNRSVRQGAFDLTDYHLANAAAMPGDSGPIELTATFQERKEEEWPDEIVAQLGDVINQVIGTNGTNLQSVVLQVTSSAPSKGKEEQYDWNFLDAAGSPVKKNFSALTALQTLRPFFALNALRDAAREFSKRSTYFGPFINEPTFDDQVKEDIVASLDSINDQVLAAHAAFDVLKENLNAGNRVVQPVEESVKIEAVPSRLSDLLANTQVSFQNPSGVTLPLERHGSGTQSLSVLSLFRAYIEAKLTTQNDPLSRPIVTIEEPESHLHPTAVRSLWSRLAEISGQTVVTTHSGDLVSEAPLKALRRLAWDGATMTCRQVDEAQFAPNELRNLNYQIRITRGELLFARKWLLVEGRSEVAILPEFARLSGVDLLGAGVRIVEFAQHGGPAASIKLADQLGINWVCLSDSDAEGLKYANSARSLLNGRVENDHITILNAENLETYLCRNGFLEIYLNAVPTQNPPVEQPGTDAYYIEVAKKATNAHSKEELALKVTAELESNPLLFPSQMLGLIRSLAK